MASFDFIDAAARGYDVVFRNFVYLARVSLPVLFMTILCFLILKMVTVEISAFRVALILFPAFLVQGLYCSGLVRFVLYGEPIHVWGSLVPVPEKMKKSSAKAFVQGYLTRTQSLQAGAVSYVLVFMINMFVVGVMGELSRATAASIPPDAPQPNDADALAGLIMFLPMLVALIWSYRLQYIYIPISMGFSYREYMHAMGGMMSSVAIIVMVLLCTLPIMTISVPILQVVAILFKPIPSVLPVVSLCVVVMVLLVTLSVIVAAASFGINQVMQKDSRSR